MPADITARVEHFVAILRGRTLPLSARVRRPTTLGRLIASAVAALTLAPVLLVASPVVAPSEAPTAAAAAPAGFVDETIETGLSGPTAMSFAGDGRVFVAEKRGIVKTWGSYDSLLAATAPGETIDIRSDVMNYWDRGLLGMAVHPAYPSSPYLYLLYSYDRLPGQTATDPPKWNTGDPNFETCNGPGGNTDGCVIMNRLDRITINPVTGISTARTELLTGWCQQFPSHSAGSLAFGADGMLYVTAGEGAGINIGSQDFGQKGGTRPDTTNPITPKNPCGDPPGAPGDTLTAPTAQGGALRSQSFRRAVTEAGLLSGAVLRLDPATGAAAAGNPAIGNADPIRRRIVAYGLRNPFRITFRPGTNDLYVGDVGYDKWEEINRLATPTASPPLNYGWPCFEGSEAGTYYTSVTLDLCSSLAAGAVTAPLWAYPHVGDMAPGDSCPPDDPTMKATASVSGLAFYTAAAYPAQYRKALFVADYSRNCIVVLPDRGGGIPGGPAIPFMSGAAGPVALTTDPDGNIAYAAFGAGSLNAGSLHRIRYNQPIASFTATPSSGAAPLEVDFDASASSASAGITGYVWDFGDGSPNGSGVTTTHTFAAGNHSVRLTVTDGNGQTAQHTATIASNNTPPVAKIDLPTCRTDCWQVGDTVSLTGSATDAEQGTLPASAFSWHVDLEHCASPTNCHEHPLFDKAGVKTTSFVAPDHDDDAFFRVTLTVTDAGGLTDTDTIDIRPKTATLRVVSSPAGLPVSLEGVNGAGSVGPRPFIVGHGATVGASATAAIGESTYAFQSWSDGGAMNHTVTVPTTATTRTATYRLTGSDGPDTCAAAPIQPVTGSWTTGRFGSPGDIDWIRFSVTTSATYQISLGGLPVDGTLKLYSGCSTKLLASNHAGTHWEEIITSLKPGTYAVRMEALGTGSSLASHQWRVKRLSGTVPILSSAVAETTGLRFVGDVYNTSTTPRAVTVTARLYSANGTLLKTASVRTLIPTLAGRSRSPYVIKMDRPAGYASAKIAITSSSARTATRQLSVSGVTSTAPTTSSWRVAGTITNTSATTARSVAYVASIYDAFGSIQGATAASPTSSTLAPKAKTTFVTTFSGLAARPNGTTVRARAI